MRKKDGEKADEKRRDRQALRAVHPEAVLQNQVVEHAFEGIDDLLGKRDDVARCAERPRLDLRFGFRAVRRGDELADLHLVRGQRVLELPQFGRQLLVFLVALPFVAFLASGQDFGILEGRRRFFEIAVDHQDVVHQRVDVVRQAVAKFNLRLLHEGGQVEDVDEVVDVFVKKFTIA
ncbi:MAG: hypothetical protein M5R36_07550 [Deltaproteobacteria bacterium]|nr:hypothetical protein [Deltaproteobacteria bacterium]